MKILQIGATFVGAQRKIEYGIHQCLLSRGHDSLVLYTIGDSNDPFIKDCENIISDFFRRAIRKITKTPRVAFMCTIRMIKEIERFKPDVVNLHILHHGYIDYVMLLRYLARKKIPVVLTAHDMWFFTGGCYYYTKAGCNQFQSGCKNCPLDTKELDCSRKKTSKYLKMKLKLYDQLSDVRFVSVSPWVYSEMMKSELSKYPQYVIMNAVDKNEKINTSVGKNDRFTIIGVAANWDDRKGIDRFYELAKQLGDQCEVVLVGNISEKKKAEAPPNIRFTGPINDTNRLGALYASSDLHVSMSLEETFGLTFVEAALAGIRSIGFNSTAIPTVLSKTGGYVVDTCTVEKMIEKVRELMENRKICEIPFDERDEIGQYFSSNRMANEYLKIFSEMCTIEQREVR